MARKPRVKATNTEPSDETAAETFSGSGERRRGGPRLTPAQRAEIVAALERGESGPALAQRYGVSVGAIYSYRRKGTQISGEPEARPESELRRRLVSFAVRTLLGQDVSEEERGELETQVRDELIKRLAAGI